MNDSTTTSTYQGRHRDVSETARWINVLKELGPESVALHDAYEPRHSAGDLRGWVSA